MLLTVPMHHYKLSFTTGESFIISCETEQYPEDIVGVDETFHIGGVTFSGRLVHIFVKIDQRDDSQNTGQMYANTLLAGFRQVASKRCQEYEQIRSKPMTSDKLSKRLQAFMTNPDGYEKYKEIYLSHGGDPKHINY